MTGDRTPRRTPTAVRAVIFLGQVTLVAAFFSMPVSCLLVDREYQADLDTLLGNAAISGTIGLILVTAFRLMIAIGDRRRARLADAYASGERKPRRRILSRLFWRLIWLALVCGALALAATFLFQFFFSEPGDHPFSMFLAIPLALALYLLLLLFDISHAKDQDLFLERFSMSGKAKRLAKHRTQGRKRQEAPHWVTPAGLDYEE